MYDWTKLRISDEPPVGPMPVIQLPPDEVIGSTAQMQRLARLLTYLDVPRRKVPEWVTNVCYSFEGEVRDSRGRLIDIDQDELERSFNKDRSYRWISDFWKWADRKPRQRAQERVVERLRYITAAAAVYEFEYGCFYDSISVLNPFHRLSDFENVEDAIAFRERHRFFFLTGYKMNDRYVSVSDYKIDHSLKARSFTVAAVARRYVKWLVTYLFPIMPKRMILWLISK